MAELYLCVFRSMVATVPEQAPPNRTNAGIVGTIRPE
jgi:hypothetical protein